MTAAGADVSSLRHSDWARRVTFVPQAPVLISGTIADNVHFFRDFVTDDDIPRALRQA